MGEKHPFQPLLISQKIQGAARTPEVDSSAFPFVVEYLPYRLRPRVDDLHLGQASALGADWDGGCDREHHRRLPRE